MALLARPSKSVLESETPTLAPTDTHIPTVTNTATVTPSPSRIPTQTVLPFENASRISIDEQRALMSLVISSGYWEQLGLPEQLEMSWQLFAERQVDLTSDGTRLMAAFFAQWGMLNELLAKSQLKNKKEEGAFIHLNPGLPEYSKLQSPNIQSPNH